MVGLSRKGMMGTITGRTADARVAGSLAAAVVAVQNGARIVRAHDVGRNGRCVEDGVDAIMEI